MAKKDAQGEILRCSFCNKDQNNVRKLIAGPMVFICDECVEVCNDIIADDEQFEAYKASGEVSATPGRPRVEPATMGRRSWITWQHCPPPTNGFW